MGPVLSHRAANGSAHHVDYFCKKAVEGAVSHDNLIIGIAAFSVYLREPSFTIHSDQTIDPEMVGQLKDTVILECQNGVFFLHDVLDLYPYPQRTELE